MISCFTVCWNPSPSFTCNFPPRPAPNRPLTEEKRACNWCFQQANCALAHKAERGAAAATVDSFVRQSTDRGGGALDRVQQELAGKYERAAGHMTQAGESCAAWVAVGWVASWGFAAIACHMCRAIAAARCARCSLLAATFNYLCHNSSSPIVCLPPTAPFHQTASSCASGSPW